MEVWLIGLPGAGDGAGGAGGEVLDAAERARARGFVRAGDRARYRAAHRALRYLLGAYQGLAPHEVVLARDECLSCGGRHGRPRAVPVSGAGAAPHFSLSYAGDLALAAFAARPVGVDIEDVPSLATAGGVAGLLHPREQDELNALRPGGRAAAFARCWARKEACLKGTGRGLAEGVAEPYVGCGERPAAEPDGWELYDLPVRGGSAAALAVRAAGCTPLPPGAAVQGVGAGRVVAAGAAAVG
ncbi:4'-phosphopantetheinyl transferase family protein [Streptomyces sp. AC154]|uniref:4'-phosphopantetheinyl transferase family protein n=1 Tax=Streptomyces sp. AC154 TaxID=3143184 RepID=UPI003F81291F